MKSLILILLPIASFAKAPKDANTIIIKGVSLNEIQLALLDSSYGIERIDKEMMTLRTEPIRYIKYWNGAYKMNIRIKDSVAYFTGIYQCPYETFIPSLRIGKPVQADTWDSKKRIVYQTNKKGEPLFKSMKCHPFLMMNQFVKCFGKEISYTKQ